MGAVPGLSKASVASIFQMPHQRCALEVPTKLGLAAFSIGTAFRRFSCLLAYASPRAVARPIYCVVASPSTPERNQSNKAKA